MGLIKTSILTDLANNNIKENKDEANNKDNNISDNNYNTDVQIDTNNNVNSDKDNQSYNRDTFNSISSSNINTSNSKIDVVNNNTSDVLSKNVKAYDTITHFDNDGYSDVKGVSKALIDYARFMLDDNTLSVKDTINMFIYAHALQDGVAHNIALPDKLDEKWIRRINTQRFRERENMTISVLKSENKKLCNLVLDLRELLESVKIMVRSVFARTMAFDNHEITQGNSYNYEQDIFNKIDNDLKPYVLENLKSYEDRLYRSSNFYKR